MRAVVICRNSPLSGRPGATWGTLAPLVDRPFLQHLVETIAEQGVREVDFILEDAGAVIAEEMGSGIRWGGSFRYYSVEGFASVYDAFRELPRLRDDEYILLAHGDRLPPLLPSTLSGEPALLCWRENEELHWTGWGIVRVQELLSLARGSQEQGLYEHLQKAGCGSVCLDRPLTARSYEDLLRSNRRVLSREFPGLLMGGKEVQPGVWIARNVKVHPTATIAPPAFLGENCRVGALAQIGPGASIGNNCTIEQGTHVADSVVYCGSYIGGELALRNVVVDRSRLVSATWGAEIEGVDELLLGSVFGATFKSRAARFGSRLAAGSAVVLSAPCLAAMLVGSLAGMLPAPKRTMVVLTPSVSESYRWKAFGLWSFGELGIPAGHRGWLRHCFLCFLPGLAAIAAGHLALMGPAPATKEEIEAMPADTRWKRLHQRSGLLPLGISLSAGAKDSAAFADSSRRSPGGRMGAAGDYASRVFRSCLFGLDAQKSGRE